MDFVKGDRVRLLGRPEWGPGKVLRNSKDGKVHVEFEYAGDKLLQIRYAKIFKVSAVTETHPTLSQKTGLQTPLSLN